MTQTIRAASLASFADMTRSIGLDPMRLLDAVRISRAALEDPDLRIPAHALRDLYELCSCNAEDFGLRIVERRSLAVLGPLLLILREQPTVRAAIDAAVRYSVIHNEASSWEVEEGEDLATVRFISHYAVPGPNRQVVEAGAYQMMRCIRLFLGPGWRPMRTYFIHTPPASLSTHHRVFGTSILFNQDFDGFVFPRSVLDAPNEAADPEIRRQMETYVQSFVRPGGFDTPERVRELVTKLLPIGPCHITEVARQMGMDARTLQRRLAREKTTFHDLVQDVRMALTVQYIEESDRPLTEVADLLGFSALSAFSRWHRDQFGGAAADRRAKARVRRQLRAAG